ncbi:MAG: Cof-type HAD-IIB family hydrolase [Rikenellaceae bacterium]
MIESLKYKILVLDIDGTLTNSRSEITQHTFETLERAQQQGVRLVLASGRPTYGITPIARRLKMDKYGGFILSFNGGKIIDLSKDEAVFSTTLSREFVPRLHQLALAHNTIILSYDQQDNIIAEDIEDQYVLKEVLFTGMKTRRVENFSDEVTYDIDKCLIVGDPENIEPLRDAVVGELGSQLNAFCSHPFFLEVVPKEIDKAQSLARLLEYTGEERESMITIGDGMNDLSMIEFAGLGVAMSNAMEPVKEVADYITLSNDQDGVAYMVEKFIFGNN